MSEKPKNVKQLLLPISRIKTIMKSSPEIINVGQDSAFLVAKAAEYFIAYLASECLKNKKDGTSLGYSDVCEMVNLDPKLEFLQDIIPPKITGKAYLEIRRQAEEEEQRKLAIIEN